MEAVSCPRAAKPGTSLTLDVPQALLGAESGRVVLRVIVDVAPERQVRIRLKRRVEAQKQGLALVNALQGVHPVSHGDVVQCRAPPRPAQEVPRRPGAAAL